MTLVKSLAAATAVAPCWEPSRHMAQDYKDEYTVSTVVPAPFPWGLAAERWAELVAERTDGRINMQIYPGAQLVQGEQTREFTAMRSGVIDMAVGSTINWSPQITELNIFSMPFLMPDYAALDALTQGPVGERIFEADPGERRGAAGLGRERLSRGDQLAARRSARRPTCRG
jgi:TRAP-type transport system periplasmic protein